MACTRRGSLNAVEDAFKGKAGGPWRRWMGGALPSADRLGEVAALVDPDELRAALLQHHYRRKRKKTLPPLPGGLRVLILDGHEMGASYRRSCPDALTRQVPCNDGEHTQHYLRYVAAYLMGARGRLLIDLEMQRPREGETAAAQRLLQRLLHNCPRAFNLVAGDALYLHPDLCRAILDSNKHFIAVLKNENRELIQDFRALMELACGDPLRLTYNGKQCACHDIEGFDSWDQLAEPVRVVRSLETAAVRRQLTKQTEELRSEWLWATSLPKAKAGTAAVVRIGHSRWAIENHGFNELARAWKADHVYRLDLNAVTVILLLIFLAYNVFHVWLERGLKPALRQAHAADYFAGQVQAEFYVLLLRPG